ncbi:MerR family transcriptional regulator [Desulfitobacterium metallireducens]|uniref:MerR family transcriptional regulator n=1 Tax=Desulfitobacterium metallireducens DSM 15288 TaxID=871968 RepID=W0E5M8_9FIRM|nr:MerR family transcriptional regulator [Desulfitobacterium metallireducens]AHF06062.1 MerR family transcriptional regulator [Desulfitobacterium metallireducens DSM 15288]
MENRIRISDFAKLTGSTLKTIMYYHKIGLLQEPERSSGGYRLYGPAELTRMQSIKRLKSLGLDLKRIKEILGKMHNLKTMREVLQSLRTELLNEITTLEERVAKIEKLLDEDAEDAVFLDENTFESPSFQRVKEILGHEQIDKYIQTSPEIYAQQQKLFGILDDFQWGQDHRETFLSLAEYFKDHPEKYQMALDSAKRLTKLDQLSADDPEVEALAKDSAEIMKSIPLFEGVNPSLSKAMENLYDGMVAGVLSPARMKHKRLVEQYLKERSGFDGKKD